MVKMTVAKGPVAKKVKPKTPLRCTSCSLSFKTNDELDAHAAQSHGEDSVGTSTTAAGRRKLGEKRVRKLSRGGRVDCMVKDCSVTFTRRDNMLAHMQVYHPVEAPKYIRGRGKEGGSGQASTVTADETQEKFLVRFQCSKCLKTFATSSYMDMHYQNVHAGVTYPCPLCKQVSNSRGYLARHFKAEHHLKSSHKLGGVARKCDICRRILKDSSSFDIHRYSMHGTPMPER